LAPVNDGGRFFWFAAICFLLVQGSSKRDFRIKTIMLFLTVAHADGRATG
jgi:hypothetical protein